MGFSCSHESINVALSIVIFFKLRSEVGLPPKSFFTRGSIEIFNYSYNTLLDNITRRLKELNNIKSR